MKIRTWKLPGISLLLASGAWAAQNGDISLLVGPLSGTSETVSGTHTSVVTSAGGNLQIAFGYQVLRTPAGDLWVESPFTFAISGGTVTGGPNYSSVSAGGWFAWAPGVRFKVPVESHVAFYGVAGGGVGVFGYSLVASGPYSSTVGTRTTDHGVVDFGGGIDFRLTRLLSIRGEVRDFVSGRGLGGETGRNHVLYAFGLAFHF